MQPIIGIYLYMPYGNTQVFQRPQFDRRHIRCNAFQEHSTAGFDGFLTGKLQTIKLTLTVHGF
jgi:hypothetical protein